MMAEPSAPLWLEVGIPAIGLLVTLVTALVTKERAGSVDHTKLENAVKDVEALKIVTTDHTATLATQATLHKAHESDIERLDETVRIVKERQDQALGREQAKDKHDSGRWRKPQG